MSADIVAIVALSATSRRHLARALEEHRRWCRVNGAAFPADLAQLAVLVDRNGQERPTETDDVAVPQAPPMAIALRYQDAAALLSVSVRQIGRLVADGRLRAITVGGPRNRRIHRDDLDAYADSLRHPQEVSS